MNKIRIGIWGVTAAILVGGLTAGCTQNDVQHADQTFSQVAQGTHNVGKKMAHEADEAGDKIGHEANEAGHKIDHSADKAGHKINQKVKNEDKPDHD